MVCLAVGSYDFLLNLVVPCEICVSLGKGEKKVPLQCILEESGQLTERRGESGTECNVGVHVCVSLL